MNICHLEFVLELMENTDLSSRGHVIKATWGWGYRKCYLYLSCSLMVRCE